MDNLILKGILDAIYGNMEKESIVKIHLGFCVIGSKDEYVPEGLVVNNQILILNVTPHAIGQIFYNENETVTIQLVAKGKRVETTLKSSLLCNITLFYADGTIKTRPMTPMLYADEYSELTQENVVSEAEEKRSKLRVLC